MGKDPAFLFYPGDWLGGTMHMHRICRACYFDLLILQWSREAFTLEEAQNCLGSDFVHWEEIKDKFKQEDSRFYNEKLRYEINRRKAFSESRKKGAYAKHMQVHMENENENEIINTNLQSKNKESKSEEFWKQLKTAYPDNGSWVDPAAERSFLRLIGSGYDPKMIIKRAKEFGEYYKDTPGYPHCKFIGQMVNWLDKCQFAQDWAKKAESDKKTKEPVQESKSVPSYHQPFPFPKREE